MNNSPTVRRLLFRLAGAALVSTVAGCTGTGPAAAPKSDLEGVLDSVHARFRDADAITVETLVSVGGGGSSFLRTTWAKPSMLREERWDGDSPDGEPASVRVTDGTTSWLYFPGQKKYYRQDISPDVVDRVPFLLGFTREGRLAVAGIEAGREEELVFGGGILCMPIKGGGTLALAADAEAGGQPCRVVTYTVGGMVQTFYVAKADGTPVRFTLESRSEHNGKTFTTSAASAVRRVDTTARPDAALFRWTPPEGATQAAKAGEDRLLAAGTAAPELGAVDAKGQPVRLSDFKGKVVLLNFWFLG